MDVRWQQRFSNYKKALANLSQAVDLMSQRPLSNLEKQGVVQAFEFTHELSWKMIKDFFDSQGNSEIYGSKDATRQAFKFGLIKEIHDVILYGSRAKGNYRNGSDSVM